MSPAYLVGGMQSASKKKIEILTVSSNYHCEINPSDVGVQDRVVVMTLIKEIAGSQTIETNKGKAFKVVLMTEVQMLNLTLALNAIRPGGYDD